MSKPPNSGATIGAMPLTNMRREKTRGSRALLAVAHDRPGDHDGDTASEPLEEAQHHERRGSWCERAGEAAHGVPPDAPQQRAAPATGIADRAAHELTECEPEQARGQRELDLGFGHPQAVRDLRQGREIHVERQRWHAH